MADPIHGANLADEIAELRRRLVALERSAQLTQSSIKGGSLDILDSSGNVLAKLGDTTYGQGIEAYDSSGNVVARLGTLANGDGGIEVGLNPDGTGPTTDFRISRTGGLDWPFLTHGWQQAGEFSAITSGSFATAWDSRVELVTGANLRTTFTVVTDVGTTGEVRVRCVTTGGVTSSKTCPAGVQTDSVVTWIHGLTLGTGPVVFVVEARRTGGAGAVNVYGPSPLNLGKWSSSTSGGIV